LKDYAACSGCSLCLLVCPAWRATRDPRISPEGRAKGLQAGAAPEELAASALACTLCGSCEPVCPEKIDLIGMTLALRRVLPETPRLQALRVRMSEAEAGPATPSAGQVLVLAGPALRAQPQALSRVLALLGGMACEDAGEDIAKALEAGAPVPNRRLERFLEQLRGAQAILVEDGLWMRHLRNWLPGKRLRGLGESLAGLGPVRSGLRPTDMYVIEPRTYHADYQRLVGHYDRLRVERGCATNLDLQRIAIPAGEAGWILKGRSVDRVVVERMEDAAAFAPYGHPVVHLAELADH
jgi:ferredoxin